MMKNNEPEGDGEAVKLEKIGSFLINLPTTDKQSPRRLLSGPCVRAMCSSQLSLNPSPPAAFQIPAFSTTVGECLPNPLLQRGNLFLFVVISHLSHLGPWPHGRPTYWTICSVLLIEMVSSKNQSIHTFRRQQVKAASPASVAVD